MKDGKGITPRSHSEDKKAQGFSQSGIPSKTNIKFQEGLAEDKIGAKGATGPQNLRK